MSGLDPDSYTPLFMQLADLLRAQIADGTLGPGDRMPTESDLEQTHGLSRTSIRKAMSVLRAEGLVETERGRGSHVRERAERRQLLLKPGDRVVVERGPGGTPVMIVTRKGGATERHPADAVEIGVAKR